MSLEQDHELKPEPSAKQSTRRRCPMKWALLMLAFILIVVAGIFAYMSEKKLNQMLVKTQQQFHNAKTTADKDWSLLSKKIDDLRDEMTSLKHTVTQQETRLASFQEAKNGQFERWYVAEARYLVKLAQLELSVSRNVFLANGYLEKAQQILVMLNDPKIVEIRALLKQDQDRLKEYVPIDIVALYQKWVQLDKQIETLPFALQSGQSQRTPPAVTEKNTNTSPTDSWNKKWDQALQSLKQIVVIKKNTKNVIPFILPDDKAILYANLHMQMQQASYGLLRYQKIIYQTSLQHVIDWTHLYFNVGDTRTASWLQAISALKNSEIDAAVPDISHSIPLFDAYLGR
jgi:uroporphyrin-III C-methyltransferase